MSYSMSISVEPQGDVEETLTRIKSAAGVVGMLIVDADGNQSGP